MTGDQPPPGPAPAPVDADPLAAFLKLAQQEGALEGETLEAFVTGLRERAGRVIAERLGRAETKLRVLETENQWQKDTVTSLEGAMATLEGEKAWLRETIATLERERDWLRETHAVLEQEKACLRETHLALEGEKSWLRETVGHLEGEKAQLLETIGTLETEAIQQTEAIEDAGKEREKASAAHESLLIHHRDLMAQLASQLGEIASLSPLRAREVRRRLRVLADLLRADTL